VYPGTKAGTAVITVRASAGKLYAAAAIEYYATVRAGKLSVKADDVLINYDGKPHEAATEITLPEGVTGAQIRYGSNPFDCNSQTAPTVTAPGIYRVYYVVSAPGYEDFKGSYEFEISRTDTEVVISPDEWIELALWQTASFTYWFSGEGEVTVTNLDPDLVEIQVDPLLCKVNITPLKVSKDRKARILVMGAESETAAAGFNFAEIVVIEDLAGTSASPNNRVYDGTSQTLGRAVSIYDGATITYSDAEDGVYTSSAPEQRDAGTYTTWYRVERAGSESYTGYFVTTIQKAYPVIALEGDGTTLDKGEQIRLAYEYSGDGELGVLCSNPTLAKVSLDEQTHEIIVEPTGAGTGTIVIYLTSGETDNYAANQKFITLEITDATQAAAGPIAKTGDGAAMPLALAAAAAFAAGAVLCLMAIRRKRQ